MDAEEAITSGGAEYDEFVLEDDLEQIQEEGVVAQSSETAETSVTNQSHNQKLRRLFDYHPECQIDYIETVLPKINIQESKEENAMTTSGEETSILSKLDKNHTTYPFLTIYEKTAIIGLRSETLSRGGQPFIQVPDYVTDVREIARLELEQKRLPYIVKRPLPNGTFEYWRLSDLLIL